MKKDPKLDKYGDREKIEADLEKEAILMLKAKRIGIFSFDGYYECFKFTHSSKVWFEGAFYATVSHAYNAAKTTD